MPKIVTNINVYRLFQVANCEQFLLLKYSIASLHLLEFPNQQFNVPNSLPYIAFNFG